MILDGKQLDEITAEDLRQLLGTQESLHLEFKESYESNDRGKSEILKDVTALANAEGGYLVVGVREDKNHRAAEFVSVEQPEKLSEQIRDLCADRIEKRLLGLQLRAFKVNGNRVIVVRVPNEDPKPHWVRGKSEKHVSFPRRFADGTRYMSIEEMREAVLDNRVSRQLDEIAGRLHSIQRTQHEAVRQHVPLTDKTFLDSSDPKVIRQHLDESFTKRIEAQPTFRLSLLPTPVPTNAPLRAQSDRAAGLVRNPPKVRRLGWDITPTAEPTVDDLGLTAINDAREGGLRVLWNGYAEFWCSTKTDSFAWAYADIRPPRPFLLDPIAMIESAVCMIRFAKALGQLLEAVETFELSTDFRNCKGAKMIEFPPGTTGHRHAMSDLNDPPDWLRSHIKALNEPVVRIGPVQVAIREATDSAAKTLSQEIYRRFGFLDAQVPFFDGKGQFKLHD